MIIGASWFLTHGYCEYKLYLQKVLKIEMPKTQQMLHGISVHKKKETTFLEKAEVSTWKEFLESEKLTISKEVQLQKQIGDMLLQGIVDEIAIDKSFIKIIDDKPNAYPFDSIKRQIIAYCYLFKENFETNKKIFAVLRDRDLNKIVWEQEYNKEVENDLFLTYHRIRKILLKEEEPIPTDNPNKCVACQYNEVCENSLVK